MGLAIGSKFKSDGKDWLITSIGWKNGEVVDYLFRELGEDSHKMSKETARKLLETKQIELL